MQKISILFYLKLCGFRYYVAEGVRIYNQDTWRQVTDGHGGSIVELYIKEIVSGLSTCGQSQRFSGCDLWWDKDLLS